VAKRDQSWVTEVALQTLSVWVSDAAAEARLDWKMPHEPTVWPQHHPRLQLSVPEWDIFAESRGAAHKRIMTALEEQVLRHLVEKERMAKKHGLRKTPSEMKPFHFEWLVQYQVLRQSHGRIAKGCKPRTVRSTISRGVRRAAQLLVGTASWERWLRPADKPGGRNQ
jgi:hypothetical protein